MSHDFLTYIINEYTTFKDLFPTTYTLSTDTLITFFNVSTTNNCTDGNLYCGETNDDNIPKDAINNIGTISTTVIFPEDFHSKLINNEDGNHNLKLPYIVMTLNPNDVESGDTYKKSFIWGDSIRKDNFEYIISHFIDMLHQRGLPRPTTTATG
tara:strand:+ start:9 stop:470 length:462 start_codon:yes stop_codon:yes gene_type:complete